MFRVHLEIMKTSEPQLTETYELKDPQIKHFKA